MSSKTKKNIKHGTKEIQAIIQNQETINKYVITRMRELGRKKRIAKTWWLFLRIVISILNVAILVASIVAIYVTIKEYDDKHIGFSLSEFIASVGPTTFLCILIITLLFLTIYLTFFKGTTQFLRYKYALQEMQEQIIHHLYSLQLNDENRVQKEEELKARIDQIYERANQKQTQNITHRIRENFLGED